MPTSGTSDPLDIFMHARLRTLAASWRLFYLAGYMKSEDSASSDEVAYEPWRLLAGSAVVQCSWATNHIANASSELSQSGTASLAALRRVSLEARIVSTWLTSPSDTAERNRRAARILVRATQLNSATDRFDGDRRRREALQATCAALLEDWGQEFGVEQMRKGTPNLRQMAEDVGEPLLYDDYLLQSSDAHAGASWTFHFAQTVFEEGMWFALVQRSAEDLCVVLEAALQLFGGESRDRLQGRFDTVSKEYMRLSTETYLSYNFEASLTPDQSSDHRLEEFIEEELSATDHTGCARATDPRMEVTAPDSLLYTVGGQTYVSIRIRNNSRETIEGIYAEASCCLADEHAPSPQRCLALVDALAPQRSGYISVPCPNLRTEKFMPVSMGRMQDLLLDVSGPGGLFDEVHVVQVWLHWTSNSGTHRTIAISALH